MKVKLTAIMAGPEGTHDVGTELDLPAAEAKALIDGGYAVAVPPEHETTSAKHAHAEHAVSHEKHK